MTTEDELIRAVLESEHAHDLAINAMPEGRRVAQAEVRANEAVAELDDACRAYDKALDALPEKAAAEAARLALAEFRESAQQMLI